MARIVSIRQPQPLETVVSEIRGHFYDAQGAKSKFDKHRLSAGQKLNELRTRIEAGEVGEGVSWWEWFETADFGRSRRDAEKVMKMARSDDPEAAHDTEKQAARERMQGNRDAANVRRTQEVEEYDIVEHAMNIVGKMSEQEREKFNQAYREKYDV